MATIQLWVNEVVSSGSWSQTGTTPWLDTQNQPTSYIYSTGRNSNSSVFGFANSSDLGTITKVELYIYAQSASSSNFESIVNSTGTGLGPPATWGWVSVDVTAIVGTTWTGVNAATVYFDRPNTDVQTSVDAAYLLVTYTDGIFPNKSESVSVSTTPTVKVPNLGNISKSETANITDTPLATLNDMEVAKSESVGIADTFIGLDINTPGPEISVQEEIGLSDTPIAAMAAISIVQSETLSISDTPLLDLALLFLASEAVGITDTPLLIGGNLVFSVNDLINAADTLINIITSVEEPPVELAISIDDYNDWIPGILILG